VNEQTGRVLVVDDDETVRDVVRRYLEVAGFTVDVAGDGVDGLKRFAAQPADLVVLDVMMPGINGLEVCKRLRQVSQVPIVMLTALGEEENRIAGLQLGADDYVTKPFSGDELLARLRAVLRRVTPSAEPVLSVGELRIDLEKRTVTMGGRPVSLTPIEYDLLRLLAENQGKLLTHPMILRAIWGPAFQEESNYLHVHVSHLRRKIEPDPARPRYLLNQAGVGYRLVDAAEATLGSR
jgi:DNA-binding response OmpR family regulator